MTNDINSLDAIAVFLEARGYEVTQSDDSIITRVGNFPTVITITDINGNGDPDLQITTQLTTLGQISEDRVPAFLTAALDANTRILPYAVATITSSDNPELDNPSEFPVVLTDSIPVGDISENEFQSALDSLLQAILGTRELLEIGFGSVAVASEPARIRRSQINRAQFQRLADGIRTRGGIGGDGIDLDDLLKMFILAEILIDDGFFFGEEPIVEDPLAEVDDSVDVEETTPLVEEQLDSEPASVAEETFKDTRRDFGGDFGGSSSCDSSSYDSSDFGSDD